MLHNICILENCWPANDEPKIYDDDDTDNGIDNDEEEADVITRRGAVFEELVCNNILKNYFYSHTSHMKICILKQLNLLISMYFKFITYFPITRNINKI